MDMEAVGILSSSFAHHLAVASGGRLPQATFECQAQTGGSPHVQIAVGAAEVEEVGVNEGEDILGEVGCPERDRGQVRRLSKALHEPGAVGHALDPAHRPDSD